MVEYAYLIVTVMGDSSKVVLREGNVPVGR